MNVMKVGWVIGLGMWLWWGQPVAAQPGPVGLDDGAIAQEALLHDSRSDLYRSPLGAQPAGQSVTLRLRTAADDVRQVHLQWGSVRDGTLRARTLQAVASDAEYTWWETTIDTASAVDVLSYLFVVQDGDTMLYYADDPRLDGGAGQVYPTSPAFDQGWNLYLYDPGFVAPAWAADATIYQIFPDRFRNGEPKNDPTAQDWFYPEECGGRARPITPWNSLVPDPEPNDPGRNPTWHGTYNCTFYGGDLQGVWEQLDYLQALGVTTLYFNPIFDSPSNHKYDGRDYRQVDEQLALVGDPAGSNQFFVELAAALAERDMNLILDGVPNHTSSDSPLFDRYARHPEVGACEQVASPVRSWYFFDPARPAGSGPCAGDAAYRGWFNVATLPQLDTAHPEVVESWIGADGIATRWLEVPGVAGWRIDVVPDVVGINPRFFAQMRQAVKTAHPEALLISETWREQDARLRVLGDEFDTTMNYRFRQAVLGFLRDSDFRDNDGSLPALSAREFESALRAIQEDYPPAAFATAMNLLSSHDVNRAVRVLDPDGLGEQTGFVEGRARLALAAVLQFTLPGAPTLYYGDEVGLVGFGSDVGRDDPYNRQPYPWPDAPGYDRLPGWRQQDLTLLEHYRRLGQLRRQHSFLRTGSWETLWVDEAGLIVYGRKNGEGAALVAVNRSPATQPVSLNLTGYLPWGATLRDPFGSAQLTVGEVGQVQFAVPALGYQLWVTEEGVDLSVPEPPAVLASAEARQTLTLTLQGDAGGERYILQRSRVDGGYQDVAELPAGSGAVHFVERGLENGTSYWYRAVAVSAGGVRSLPGAAVALIPHASIRSIVLEEPWVLQHTVSAIEPTEEMRAVVWIDGGSDGRRGVLVQAGWAAAGSESWTWVAADAVADSQGEGERYVARLLPAAAGDYIVRWRASTTGGREWTFSEKTGQLQVAASPDRTAPNPPFRLDEMARSGALISIAIRASRPADLFAYRVCRTDLSANEAACATQVDLARETNIFTDTAVTAGHTYRYSVQLVDNAFNVSLPSHPITLTAELSKVEVTWRVRVPAETPAADQLFIAGDNLDAFLAAYTPGLTPMVPAGDQIWEFTATLQEGTRLQYKYTRGSWESVEQWGSISGYTNRQLTVVKGADGRMQVDDTATDWGEEGPDDRRAVQFWRDPLVAAVEPAAESRGAAPAAIQVDFSIAATAVGADRTPVIVVVDSKGQAVAGTVTQPGERRFVFTPTAPLLPDSYTATAFQVEQTTAMLHPYTWRFVVEEP